MANGTFLCFYLFWFAFKSRNVLMSSPFHRVWPVRNDSHHRRSPAAGLPNTVTARKVLDYLGQWFPNGLFWSVNKLHPTVLLSTETPPSILSLNRGSSYYQPCPLVSLCIFSTTQTPMLVHTILFSSSRPLKQPSKGNTFTISTIHWSMYKLVCTGNKQPPSWSKVLNM